MPAAIPIIATVAAGAAAANGAYAIAMAITIAAQVATQMMTKNRLLVLIGTRPKESRFCALRPAQNGGLRKDCVCWHPVFL